jgi:hypothetical protein
MEIPFLRQAFNEKYYGTHKADHASTSLTKKTPNST